VSVMCGRIWRRARRFRGRALLARPQVGAAIAASVQAADDEPSQAGDGLGDFVGLGQPGAVAAGLELVAPCSWQNA